LFKKVFVDAVLYLEAIWLVLTCRRSELYALRPEDLRCPKFAGFSYSSFPTAKIIAGIQDI
jgi:hypothetical protein